ncbi:ATP-dependent helicase/deoxyribonuclease subunit B [Clostridia bacterium]|nr:ATP-dependent helicase/deoxyribonuclease subunit B [Clostridia bacterium]
MNNNELNKEYITTTIITGRPGRLLPRVVREIGDALSRDEEKLVLIVPEQYTLQAEVEILETLEIPGFFTLDVLSPSRLTERVFDAAGRPPHARISAEGKSMAVQALLDGLAPNLAYYQRAAKRRGFAQRMADQIGEFKCAGQTPASVLELASRCEGALRAKLSDMAHIFSEYEELLSGQFADGEDVQREMLRRLPASGVLSGARVWVYGFDLIVPSMVDLFCTAAKTARSFTIALTWDKSDVPDARLYAPARATLDRLARGFVRSGIVYNHEHLADDLDAAWPMRYLDKALFARKAEPYTGQERNIEMVSESLSPHTEAEAAAARTLRLIASGYRPDDIRVLHAQLDKYGGELTRAFSRMGIPVYIDLKRPAFTHPFFLGLLGAIDFAAKDSPTAALSDWIHSGFSELNDDEVSELDAYARSHALDGPRWLYPFDAPTPFPLSDDETKLRARNESWRQLAVEPLLDLRRAMHRAERSGEYARALWTFTEEAGLFDKLTALRDGLTARGMRLEAGNTAQVWQLWLNLLDQLDALLAGRQVSAALAARIVRTGIEALELGALPPERGRVMIGQIGRMKVGRVRAVLALGLSDGALVSDGGGLLTDSELLETEERLATPLGLDTRTLIALTNLNLLEALTAPTEFLYASCPSLGGEGERVQSSIVMKRVDRLFPHAKQVDVERPACLYAPGSALDALGPMLREQQDGAPLPSVWRAALSALEREPDWRYKLRSVQSALNPERERPPLSPSIAGELYHKTEYSVTRLELFAECPYRHFVRFGLNPRQRLEPKLAANLAGSFLHSAMEDLLRACETDARWPNLEREEIDSLIERELPPRLNSFENGLIQQNARMEAEGTRIINTARRACWTAVKHLTVSGFRPVVFERKFGMGNRGLPIELADGSLIELGGRIDRIDEWLDGSARYLRVIDYKSGALARKRNPFDATRFFEGLDLQLLLYLAAALEDSSGSKPAGAFLFKLDNPVLTVNPDESEADNLEEKRFKALRLRGVMLDDPRVALAMDNAVPPLSVQKMYKKGTTQRDSNSDLVSEADLNRMIRYAKHKAAALAQRIRAGELSHDPIQIGGWNACQWCDYQTVCQKDGKSRTRRVNAMSRPEMLAQIAGVLMDKP